MTHTQIGLVFLCCQPLVGSTADSTAPPSTTTPPKTEENATAISNPVSSAQAAKLVVPVTNLANRAYYRLDPTTCRANNTEHTVLKSWSNKITFTEDGMLVWGTICNDSPRFVHIREIGGDLRTIPDLTEIIYQGEHLLFQTQEPKLCSFGIWCPVQETP